jgi:regulator of sigma D
LRACQQFIGEFFGSYRLIEGPRGWLDLLAGFRYTYVGQVGLQANNTAIDAASTQLVDTFAQSLITPGSSLQTLIQQNIVNKLGALNGSNPELPVALIVGGQRGKIADLVQQIVVSQDPELTAAIRTGAQARVNQLKTQIASQVANTLTSQLNRSFSFYDSWIDPVIGLRGRFNLSKAFYLTAESDFLYQLSLHGAQITVGLRF